MKKETLCLLSAVSVLLFSGCNISKISATSRPNIGRELLDLHEARNKGLITAEEYEELREQLLESANLNQEDDHDDDHDHDDD